MIDNFTPITKQHVLNLSSAALCDIDVSYWDHTEFTEIKQRKSTLETLIVDETKIDYELMFLILKTHNKIAHISCKNTPNFVMKIYSEDVIKPLISITQMITFSFYLATSKIFEI